MYDKELCAHSFPAIRLKEKQQQQQQQKSASGDHTDAFQTPTAESSNENAIKEDTNAADTQSISSSTTTASQLKRMNISKMYTPIGIRTKAERIQEFKVALFFFLFYLLIRELHFGRFTQRFLKWHEKKIEAKLNMRTTSNSAKMINEKKNAIARIFAYSFLSNAYALWFIYLPEYLKDCGDLKKNGLNHAYQVLLQMQKHTLTQPDEVGEVSALF